MYQQEERYIRLFIAFFSETYENIKRLCKRGIKGNLNILKYNILYLVWAFIYFEAGVIILGANVKGILTYLIIYAISLCIAFSSLGEELLRFINGARSLETKKEKAYLLPIFEDVYESVKQANPNVSDKIELCIADNMTVNAFALGKHTIAVTQGAVETFTEEELKGILAHEFAHIIHGDTKANLLNFIGNGIFTVFIMIIRIVMYILKISTTPNERYKSSGILHFIVELVRLLFEFLVFAFVFLGNVVLSTNSRKNEYNADKFALDIGFGEGLIEALYLLQKISLGGKLSLIQHMQASHPHIARRIGRLESFEDIEIE